MDNRVGGHGSVEKDLTEAAQTGDVVWLRALVEAGVDPNTRLEDEQSALTYALTGHHAEAVAFFIGAGADIEEKHLPWSPLMYAAFEGDERSVDRLISAGADVFRRDSNGRTCVDIALAAGHVGLARRLRRLVENS